SKIYSKPFIEVKDENLSYEVRFKGLKEPRDIALDEKGNIYVAYESKIQRIDKNGKVYNLFDKNEFNINSMVYYEDNLYMGSDTKVYKYDIEDKRITILINDLPNMGDYNESNIIAYDGNLYITVGATTNSGVVGEDNSWLSKNPFSQDISPKSITIKGREFNGTGAFTSYKTQNTKGQLISGRLLGNSSVIKYNLENNKTSLYSWGIRNIEGIDFNSEGNIIASVGGMEDRGERPIKGDNDYIYEIKENLWYGWPDYSGGEPVTSSKFKGKNNRRVEFILENHPTVNPISPMYSHSNISSIKSLSIDKHGALGEKDGIYFYDYKDNTIYSLKDNISIIEVINIPESKDITLKSSKDGLMVLDKDKGAIYEIKEKSNVNFNRVDEKAIYISLIVIGIIVIAVAFKTINR
ncbi:hypothetical protein, partial [Clostridium sp.]|uniref:hypothetical protein n=1 Tax=Clostridium sp. TaxID=1506 RepID=UPI003464843F